MFGMNNLKNCMHCNCNQNVITVHVFGDTNAIVVMFGYCISSEMWCDYCYIWLIATHLKYDVIGFEYGSCIQLAKLDLFSLIFDEINVIEITIIFNSGHFLRKHVYTIILKCRFARLIDIIYNIVNFNWENILFLWRKSKESHIKSCILS